MFANALNDDAQGTAARFHASLTSLVAFDKAEMRGVMKGLLRLSERETCFRAIYHRVGANIESLVVLNSAAHFQAVSMVTRNLFELAIDIRLIDRVANGISKMIVYPEVEKLRCARKIVKYKHSHPDEDLDDSNYSAFIANNSAAIEQKHAALWPSKKNKALGEKIDHWSGMSLRQRAHLLGNPFDRVYELRQPRWSWQVHAGITGIVNLQKETFTLIAGDALNSCGDFYEQVLSDVIDEFQLAKHDPKIKGKLKAARMMPFADSEEEAKELYRQLAT